MRWALRVVLPCALSACGPSDGSTDPPEGAVDVGPTDPVTFQFRNAVDASDAWVQWNYHGDNGRIPTVLTSSGRRVEVVPLLAAYDGEVQEVTLHGLRSADGDELDPVRTTFRTRYERAISSFSYADGEPVGGGFTCELDDLGRDVLCVTYDSGSGKDGVPATEDDVLYTREMVYVEGLLLQMVERHPEPRQWASTIWDYTYNERGIVARLRGTAPGDDEELFTEDDEADYSDYSVFDADGFRTARWLGEPGPDGVGGTEDDRPDRFGIHYLVDEAGADVGSWEEYIYDTDPDAQVFLTNIDADGFVHDHSEFRIGPDLEPYTSDDDLRTRIEMIHADGLQVARLHRGATGLVHDAERFEYDARGRLAVWQFLSDAGEDGRWLTDDDVIVRRATYTYDANGARSAIESYVSAGEDGVWGSEDDELGQLWEYAP